MSGPKVVHIVTREEVELIFRTLLGQVEESIAALERLAKRLDCATDSLSIDLTKNREAMLRLFEKEQWLELQKRGPAIIASLRLHGDKLRADAVAAAAAHRTKGRRLADGARSIIQALQAAGLPVEDALRSAAKSSNQSDSEELAKMQAALNRGLAQMVSLAKINGQISGPAKDLADRLGRGEESQKLASWISAHVDPRDARIDALLAEIDLCGDVEAANAFSARAAGIVAEPDLSRRALLTDSLTLEAARYVQERRLREDGELRLRDASAALANLNSPEAKELSIKIKSALETSDYSQWTAFTQAAKAQSEKESAELAAEARRRAILQGLASLGYEIRETMTTALARNGRVTVHKPSNPDYGIELGAPADAARLQVRIVGAADPTSPRNAVRDKDQEVSWCGDFDRLRAVLKESGNDLVLERALDPGAQAVKTVSFESYVGHTAEIAKPSLQTRVNK